MLNKLQKTVQNEKVEWKTKKHQEQIETLVILMKHQQSMDKELIHTESDYISQYGQSLFKYFCSNPNTTEIVIRNFTSLPPRLRNTMFFNDFNQMSLIPLLKLFP
eukprot:106958_1